jgi:hypothetical protein
VRFPAASASVLTFTSSATDLEFCPLCGGVASLRLRLAGGARLTRVHPAIRPTSAPRHREGGRPSLESDAQDAYKSAGRSPNAGRYRRPRLTRCERRL